MSDELKVQLTTIPYLVVLAAEVQVNGLGEVVTIAVNDCELRGWTDSGDNIHGQLVENEVRFVKLALVTGLKAIEENTRGSRDNQALATPVPTDDGREDDAASVGGAAHAGAGTEPDGGSA